MVQDNKHAEYMENYKLNPKETACKIRTLKVIMEVKIRGWDRKEQCKEQQQKEQAQEIQDKPPNSAKQQ